MKNLIFASIFFVSISACAQNKKTADSTYKQYNPNGSYALVIKTGDKLTTTTKFSVVNNGKTSVITNPDGSKSTVVNDATTGTVFAADGNPSTAVQVITDAEAKAMEAGAPQISNIVNADGTITKSINILTGKTKSTYSSTSTTTTGTNEMTLAEKATANYWTRPAVKYAIIANESFNDVGKFELDLLSDNKNLKKSKELLYFSVGTNSTNELSSGTYKYSNKNANERGTFTFWGEVNNGKDKFEIIDGSFTAKIDKSLINVEYVLTLKNGKRISGRYEGKYQVEDWRNK